MLRFDVETIYKATIIRKFRRNRMLRFDVETIYKATSLESLEATECCGLM